MLHGMAGLDWRAATTDHPLLPSLESRQHFLLSQTFDAMLARLFNWLSWCFRYHMKVLCVTCSGQILMTDVAGEFHPEEQATHLARIYLSSSIIQTA